MSSRDTEFQLSGTRFMVRSHTANSSMCFAAKIHSPKAYELASACGN